MPKEPSHSRTGFINPLARRVAADRAPAGPQPTPPRERPRPQAAGVPQSDWECGRRGEDQWGGSRQDPPPEGIDETTCSGLFQLPTSNFQHPLLRSLRNRHVLEHALEQLVR